MIAKNLRVAPWRC